MAQVKIWIKEMFI